MSCHSQPLAGFDFLGDITRGEFVLPTSTTSRRGNDSVLFAQMSAPPETPLLD